MKKILLKIFGIQEQRESPKTFPVPVGQIKLLEIAVRNFEMRKKGLCK